MQMLTKVKLSILSFHICIAIVFLLRYAYFCVNSWKIQIHICMVQNGRIFRYASSDLKFVVWGACVLTWAMRKSSRSLQNMMEAEI